MWVAVAITWLIWPLLLIIHPQRSLFRVIVPVFISAGLLAPCLPKLDFLLSHFHGYPTKPNDPPFVEGATSLGFGFSRVVRKTGKSIQLTQQFPDLVRQMIWHEEKGYISAFTIPSAMANKSSGTWITLQFKQ